MATFSTLSITFLEAFEIDANVNSLVIGWSILGVSSGLQEVLVVTRSQANEFEQGVDATTQAQLYKDAIDIDLLSENNGEWETTIVGDTVTILSTDDRVQFNTALATNINADKIGVVIDNFSNDIALTEGLLLARSNSYITTPITNENFLELEFFFRQGDRTQALGTPEYKKKVSRPSIDWTAFDVLYSKFALDYIKPKPVYQVSNGILSSDIDSVVGTSVLTRADGQSVFQERINSVVTTRGYSNYKQGASYLETDQKILLSSTVNQVQKGNQIVIPFFNDDTLTEILIKDDTGSVVGTFNPTPSDVIRDKIQYIFFDTTGFDTRFFSVNDAFFFEVVDECRYTPQEVYFLNAFGVFEVFTFYKAKRESIDFTKSGEYKNNFVLNGNYDPTRHMYRTISKNGRTTVSLNTGNINEEQNKTIREMMNSEFIFFRIDDSFVPYNLDTNSIQLLTGLNDSLINYEVTFKESFDLVQNV